MWQLPDPRAPTTATREGGKVVPKPRTLGAEAARLRLTFDPSGQAVEQGGSSGSHAALNESQLRLIQRLQRERL